MFAPFTAENGFLALSRSNIDYYNLRTQTTTIRGRSKQVQSSREPWHNPKWPHPSPLPPRRKPKPIPRRRYPYTSIPSLNVVPPVSHSAPKPNTPPLCPRPPRDRKSKRNTDLSAWELEFQDTLSLLSVDANNLGAVEHINSALSDIKICSLNMNSLTDSKFISVLAPWICEASLFCISGKVAR